MTKLPTAELHSHLYGCLTVDDLYWLYHRKPWRKDYYGDSYRRTYGREAPLDELFRPEDRDLVARHYHYLEAADFARFQTCFDLIISVSHGDGEELAGVFERVCRQEPAAFAEYRQLFSPRDDRPTFTRKVRDLVRACGRAEEADTGTVPRIAVSLARDDSVAPWQYAVVREIMDADEDAARLIVGLDFCAMEEGNPPRAKADLFERIRRDNEARPERALAILYHVGESFQDKSVESAVRWVVEAARMGAQRLGHCVALGVAPAFYAGTTRREIPAERRDQIEFELAHADELRAAGLELEEDALRAELQALAAGPDAEAVEIHYDEARIARLERFQAWAMQAVRATGAIVESCPTSNIRIAGLGSHEYHPLKRFLAAGLPVVIGADDPGILHTDLAREFDLIRGWGVTEAEIRTMQERALTARSEILTGRVAGRM